MAKLAMVYKMIRYTLLIVGIGMMVAGGYGLSYTKRMDKEYIPIVAKIDNIQTNTRHSGKKARVNYDVRVSYVVDGNQYLEKLNSYSADMEIGSNINLKYNPENPSDIRSVEIEHTIFLAMAFVGLTILLSYFFAPYLFKKLKNG